MFILKPYTCYIFEIRIVAVWCIFTFLIYFLGRLVAGLVAEFLRFFNLDFTLAVFQPESSTVRYTVLLVRYADCLECTALNAEAMVDLFKPIACVQSKKIFLFSLQKVCIAVDFPGKHANKNDPCLSKVNAWQHVKFKLTNKQTKKNFCETLEEYI